MKNLHLYHFDHFLHVHIIQTAYDTSDAHYEDRLRRDNVLETFQAFVTIVRKSGVEDVS